jgi:hypothetical protein
MGAATTLHQIASEILREKKTPRGFAHALAVFLPKGEDEEGLKFVAVHKERLVVAVPEVERAGAAARARARQGTLSDAAPAMSADLVKLNVVKRDLRGVTAVLEEMGKKTKTGEK